MKQATEWERDFAKRLRDALDERKWTARELARRMGIAETTVGRWLKAHSMPRLELVALLASTLDLSIVTLLGISLDEDGARAVAAERAAAEAEVTSSDSDE